MSVPRPVRDLSVSQRVEIGRAARSARPRTSLGEYSPTPDRSDPVQVLAAQEQQRVTDLLPVRHARMAQSPFAFLRGSAAVMVADQAASPSTGLLVQACGDAHLANLGIFAAPDRGLVFDVNDFDETNPGPFEWDVQRLATSFLIAAADAGHRSKVARELPRVVARAYRDGMTAFAAMSDLDAYYFRIDTMTLRRWAREVNSRVGVQALKRSEREAMARTRWSAVNKLTVVENGSRRFRDSPPLLNSLSANDQVWDQLYAMYEAYRSTLLVDRSDLLARYRPVDLGHKVVGVGSVGLLAFVLLLQGRDEDDLLVLQFKEAVPSVLEPFTAPTQWASPGERVVSGQRLMQAATDAFLGWVEGPSGRSYYVRQVRDMKWSPEITQMTAEGLVAFAGMCGAALARAHARSGDSVAIAAYLGQSDRFEEAIASFARAYAAQTYTDFSRYTSAISSGAVSVAENREDPVRIVVRIGDDGSPRIETERQGADTPTT
jgi:uncharacterized protein (DUF2252 family)